MVRIHKSYFRLFPIFVLLMLLSFHILSPVADFILLGNSYVYAGVVFLLLSLLLLVNVLKNGGGLSWERDSGSVSRCVELSFLVMVLFLLLHSLFVPGALVTNVRYLMVVMVSYAVYKSFNYEYYTRFMNLGVLLGMLYVVYMILVYALIKFSVIDLNAWSVDQLNYLYGENPIVVRAEWQDYQYYMPYYSVVIAKGGELVSFSFIDFLRLRAFFVEPTDVALVFLPFLFYTLQRFRTGVYYRFCALMFMIVIIWAFAISGFLAFLIALAAYFCASNKILGLNGTNSAIVKYMSRIAVFAVCVITIVMPEKMLVLAGGNKLEQYIFFKEKFIDAKSYYLTPKLLGEGYALDPSVRSYGISAVVLRQGFLGVGVLFLILLPLMIASWRLLKTRFYFIGMAGICALVLFLKTSEIVNMFFFFIYFYVVRTYLYMSGNECVRRFGI